MVPGYLKKPVQWTPGIQRHRHAGDAQQHIKAGHAGLVVGWHAGLFARAFRERSGWGGLRASTLCARPGSCCAKRVAPALRSMANGRRFPQIPAVKGNAQQFALEHDAGIVQRQIKRQRVPHAHMLGGHQHAAFGRRRRSGVRIDAGKNAQSPRRWRAPRAAPARPWLRAGQASSGRKMIAMMVVRNRNQTMNKRRTEQGHARAMPRGHQAGQIFHIFAVQQKHGARMPPPAGKIDAALLHRIGRSRSRPAWRLENSCSVRGM